jgi:hypothetical protein
MKDKLLKYGLLVDEEHQQGRKYSSARFYELNEKNWQFLTHHEG